MIYRYLKYGIRLIWKNKFLSMVNLLGLTAGIAAFLILFIHVSNEKSFDKHFANHEQIYRVITTPEGREDAPWARSLDMVHYAAAEIPEVELSTHFSHCSEGTITIDKHTISQKDIMSVDEAFVHMFQVRSLVGDLSEILKPNTVFVSKDFAQKNFGNSNSIGKIITINSLQYSRNVGDYEIRGIVENTYPKSQLNYELLLSQKGGLQEGYTNQPTQKTQWLYNYLKLKKGTNPKQVADKLKASFDDSGLKNTRGPKDYSFSLFPMDDIHLKSNFRFELRDSSSKINISLFIGIALIVLLISLLNFTNLTIAKLIKRSKELGLKRSIGASNQHLVKQVLSEVFVVCSIAIILSLAAIQILKPIINQLFEIDFAIYYTEPIVYLTIIGVLVICLLVTALFVISYLLTRNSALHILSNRNNFSGNYVLKSLLVVQVSIVIILISSAILVNKQINFVLNKPLGFDKDNVVVLEMKDLSKDPHAFFNELRKQSSIESVGMTAQHFAYPAQGLPLDGLGLEGTAEFKFANFDYLKTMNIKLIENWVDTTKEVIEGMVVNQHLYNRLMEKHGSMENLLAYQSTQPLEEGEMRINFIGVAKDFNYSSAHKSIGDFAFWLGERNQNARFTHVRINNLHAGMDAIQNVWDEYHPNQELIYFFLNDKLASQYKSEALLKRILITFSILGILIAIIGISALSIFIAQQRTKEIGIRKVNGAKISEVLVLLNKDFVKWVVIAFVIATPVAWFTMHKWLENFAYKTNLSWWIFVFAGFFTIITTLITISWQSWKAATRNPVEALRNE